MSLGGISNIRTGGQGTGQGQGTAGNQAESQGKEFSLEKQKAGTERTALISNQVAQKLRGKTSQIIDRKRRNKKGAPRTIIVDGEIYEVFLLAIA
jgi:hypothetical protein